MYNSEVEKKKLYYSQPNYYTDARFIDSRHNSYKKAMIHWTRFKDISLETCIRKTLRCRNIPVGTIVTFQKSWYTVGKKIDNGYRFVIKKENKLDLDFEVSIPEYAANFSTCEFSQKLTNALREKGFLVEVFQNSSFLTNMVNTAIALTGKDSFMENKAEGEIAIAYGYGKKIGFSSYDNDFYGYTDGYKNVLFDYFGEFNKWSQCRHIPKTTPIDEIVASLMEKNPREEEEEEAYNWNLED